MPLGPADRFHRILYRSPPLTIVKTVSSEMSGFFRKPSIVIHMLTARNRHGISGKAKLTLRKRRHSGRRRKTNSEATERAAKKLSEKPIYTTSAGNGMSTSNIVQTAWATMEFTGVCQRG